MKATAARSALDSCIAAAMPAHLIPATHQGLRRAGRGRAGGKRDMWVRGFNRPGWGGEEGVGSEEGMGRGSVKGGGNECPTEAALPPS